MEHDQDFSKLRDLLALTRVEMPKDTQIDQFLIEFHRRQRAQLLVPETALARLTGWIRERFEAIQWVPTLSYGSAFAAIALATVLGLSQQVQVTEQPGHPFKLAFGLNNRDSAFAMIPSSLGSASLAAPKTVDNANAFSPSHSDSATTRFVLANNSTGAYDSTVAF